MEQEVSSRKYAFVCGLPGSGTSLVGRNIARMENCTGFKNTGVFEDEGQFLQDVYAVASEYGGSSRVGFDARAHRTENSDLLTATNVAKLKASWEEYWEADKAICVEKTPENLLMTRFLQAAFPDSYFIVIRRHPVPVSLAGRRWKINLTSLDTAFRHWLHCHGLFEGDRKYLKRVCELRYEDYVEDQDKHPPTRLQLSSGRGYPSRPRRTPIGKWRSGEIPPVCVFRRKEWKRQVRFTIRSILIGGTNFSSNRHLGFTIGILRAINGSEFRRYGYSLISGMPNGDEILREGGPIANLLGVLLCIAADTGALLWRTPCDAE